MADVEGEKIDNKARLEALKQQESLIKEEKEELQKEDIKAVSNIYFTSISQVIYFTSDISNISHPGDFS